MKFKAVLQIFDSFFDVILNDSEGSNTWLYTGGFTTPDPSLSFRMTMLMISIYDSKIKRIKNE